MSCLPGFGLSYDKKRIILALILFSFAANAEDVIVNPPRELDFLSREEIFSVRQDMMRRYPLTDGGYTLQGPVYNQVVGGKEWPGISGVNCRGNGESMTFGVSRESIFIDNPLLLIGITTGGFRLSGWDCPDIYPVPTRIFSKKKNQEFMSIMIFLLIKKCFGIIFNVRCSLKIFTPVYRRKCQRFGIFLRLCFRVQKYNFFKSG